MKPKADEPDGVATVIIPELAVTPEGAMALGDIIEQRCKDLLSLSCLPKELTDALKVSIEWWKARRDAEADDGYGSKLGKGTMRDA